MPPGWGLRLQPQYGVTMEALVRLEDYFILNAYIGQVGSFPRGYGKVWPVYSSH